MKKIVCILITLVMVLSSAVVPTFAMQEDVKKAYTNELEWIRKTETHYGGFPVMPLAIEYCAYDINKDGIKELIVKNGTCEADYLFTFYTCEYGKIVRLGQSSGFHTVLYECDINGIFAYMTHMGIEELTRVSKNGHSLTKTEIFYNDLNSYAEKGYDIPWHEPKRPIKMYEIPDYSGLY